jgi:uncharacterized membrane protein
MITDKQMENYLATLRLQLAPLTLGEREEIVMEIVAHVRDSAEQSGASVESVLTRLGPAEELAAQYRDGLLIRRASRSFSPIVLLRATLRLATRSVAWIFVFFLGVFGYAFGAGFVIIAFAKMIVPSHAGAWVQDGRLSRTSELLYTACRRHAHEVLGLWIIPIGLTAGSLTLLLTTFLIRNSLRVSRLAQSRL